MFVAFDSATLNLDLKTYQNEHSAVGDPVNQKLCIVSLSKTAFPGTKRRFAVFKILWQIVRGIFSHLVFFITLPKIIARTQIWAVSTRLNVSYNL
jgi:hypothetical protein